MTRGRIAGGSLVLAAALAAATILATAWTAAPARADDLPAVGTWLLGTWKHVSVSKTPDGPRKEIHSDIRWTFEADGKGTYHQKPMFSSHATEREMSWKLEGDTIVVGPTRYTIVSREADTAVWKNERQGNFYQVERMK